MASTGYHCVTRTTCTDSFLLSQEHQDLTSVNTSLSGHSRIATTARAAHHFHCPIVTQEAVCLKYAILLPKFYFSKGEYPSRLRPFSGPVFGVDSGSSIHFGLNLGQQNGSPLEVG